MKNVRLQTEEKKLKGNGKIVKRTFLCCCPNGRPLNSHHKIFDRFKKKAQFPWIDQSQLQTR